MHLSFQTEEIRDICEKRAAAAAALGLAISLELAQRLADIDAVDTVADLMLLFSEIAFEREDDTCGLRLSNGLVLSFRSGHVKTPLGSTGKPDWAKVTRVRIMEFEAAGE